MAAAHNVMAMESEELSAINAYMQAQKKKKAMSKEDQKQLQKVFSRGEHVIEKRTDYTDFKHADTNDWFARLLVLGCDANLGTANRVFKECYNGREVDQQVGDHDIATARFEVLRYLCPESESEVMLGDEHIGKEGHVKWTASIQNTEFVNVWLISAFRKLYDVVYEQGKLLEALAAQQGMSYQVPFAMSPQEVEERNQQLYADLTAAQGQTGEQ